MKPHWDTINTTDLEGFKEAINCFKNPKFVGNHIWVSTYGGKTYVKVSTKEVKING